MLTLKNYFTKENNYLSNSKLGDYLKSPHYFYKKHVLREIEQKSTDAMQIGKAVDFLLAQDENAPKFKVVERRNLKNPPKDYIEVNQAQYDEIVALANAVANNNVFKNINKTFKKQELLVVEQPIGELFAGMCGLPDYIKVTKDKIIIVDLKTAQTVNSGKYFYHSLEYGYFRQQAFYQMLAESKYPGRNIESYHLVVDKIKDIYDVKLYLLDQEIIEEQKNEINEKIDDIARRKNWDRPNLDWDDALFLTDPRKRKYSENDHLEIGNFDFTA